MKLTNLIGLLFLSGFCACNDSTIDQPVSNEASPAGFSISSSPRSGFGYIDSNGTAYVYYHITSTITNDSTIPMRVFIAFSNDNSHTHDSLRSPVFLLPAHRLITDTAFSPLNKQIDLGMQRDIKWFLDRVANVQVSLDTLLDPKEKCDLTFGILNKVTYPEPYAIALKASTGNSSAATLELKFDRISGSHYMIPCGQVSFLPNN